MKADLSPYAIFDKGPPSGASVMDMDPFSEAFLSDPFPEHERLREAGSYVWLSRYNIGAVARYEHVREVLLNWRTFSSARGVGMEDFAVHGRFRLPSLILEADPPEHTRSRGILSRVLSPPVLKSLRDRFFTEAERLVSELLDKRRIDAISDLAEAFPLRVFPDAIGIGRVGREKLLPHAEMLFNSFGPRNELFENSFAKASFAWVDEQGRRENLADDGLGMRVHEAAEKEGMAADEAAMLVRALLQAGLDTTINGLGATIYNLVKTPSQWNLLKENPNLAKAAFDEAIRLESPVQTFFRTATCDTELGGVQVNSGDKVLMFLAAANRDPRQWSKPSDYDIRRKTIGHVGFGAGIHACVGQLLSKLEAEALLWTFAQRVTTIAFAGKPTFRLNNTIRGLASLPIAIG
jgi:cytochrome P450